MVNAGKMQTYQQECNTRSLDGLPGLRSALKDSGHHIWRVELENWLSRHWNELETVKLLALLMLVGVVVLRWDEYALLGRDSVRSNAPLL